MSDSDSSYNSDENKYKPKNYSNFEYPDDESNIKRKKPSKNDHIYGIFNESSDEDNKKDIFNFTKKNHNNYSNFVHGSKKHLNDDLNNEGVKVIIKNENDKIKEELLRDLVGKNHNFEEIENNINFLNQKKKKFDQENIEGSYSDFIDSEKEEDKFIESNNYLPNNFGRTKDSKKTSKKIDKLINKVEEDELTSKEKEYSQIYGKAFKMLKKTGFKFGEHGLGKNKQGILEPIKIQKTEGKQGVSYDTLPIKKEKQVNENNNIKKVEKTELDEYDKLIKNWDVIKIRLRKFDNIDDLSNLIDFTKLLISNKNLKDNNMKIVDMRGPRASIINSLSEVLSLNEKFKSENFDFNEIKGKLVFLMKKCKYKIGNYFNQLKHMDDMNFASNFEISSIVDEANIIRDSLLSQNAFNEDLIKTRRILENSDDFSESDLLLLFENLYYNNKKEYLKHQNLTLNCVKLLIKKYKSKKLSLNYFLEGKEILINEFTQIKKFIDLSSGKTTDFNRNDESLHYFSKKYVEDENDLADKVFSLFLFEIFVSDLINYIINQWKVKDSYFLIDIIDAYNTIIPKYLIEYVINSAILPRITEEIKAWSPLNNSNPINIWFHPWLPCFNKDQLDFLIQIIQNKFTEFVINWNTSDSSLLNLLLPWKKIFHQAFWSSFIRKYVVPKLTFRMEKLEINPSDQDINPLLCLMDWQELIPEEVVIKVLSENFFPKWLNTLYTWFNNKYDIKEIYKWYSGWKGFFPSNIIQNEEVKNNFKIGLELIHKHL